MKARQSRTFVSGASGIAPQPVSASPGSHLLLDLIFAWVSSAPELPLSWQVHLWPHLQGPNVSQADKVHWFINHGTVNLLPLLLQQGFLYICQPSLSPGSLLCLSHRGLLLWCLDHSLLTSLRCNNIPGLLSWMGLEKVGFLSP